MDRTHDLINTSIAAFLSDGPRETASVAGDAGRRRPACPTRCTLPGVKGTAGGGDRRECPALCLSISVRAALRDAAPAFKRGDRIIVAKLDRTFRSLPC